MRKDFKSELIIKIHFLEVWLKEREGYYEKGSDGWLRFKLTKQEYETLMWVLNNIEKEEKEDVITLKAKKIIIEAEEELILKGAKVHNGK